MIEFKKKTISTTEGTNIDTQILYISNPDNRASLYYFIDTKNIQDTLIFNMVPNEGTVEPTETQEVKISFKPVVPGSFEFK